jgi:IS1 family transposase
MNVLSLEKQVQIVNALVRGNTIRGTADWFKHSKNTVMKFQADLGKACYAFNETIMRSLPCVRLQCDEMWSFCYAKDWRIPPDQKFRRDMGDAWVWVAICADTKLVPHWHVGKRERFDAQFFMNGLSNKMGPQKVQISTDGFRPYVDAVLNSFGSGVDYGSIKKREVKVGPKKFDKQIFVDKQKWFGRPKTKYISTSFVERQNRTMRRNLVRLARKSDATSKKIENHVAALALHFTHYNFVRVHQTLKTTPAVVAGIAKEPWTYEQLVELL